MPLGYVMQKEVAGDRASTKVDKLLETVGWQAGLLNGNGDKAKACTGRLTSGSKANTTHWLRSASMTSAAGSDF